MTRSRFVFLLACAAASLHIRPVAVAQTAGQPVRAKHAMVATSEALASQVGVDVLKRGGNAVDAAVAVGLAMAVTYPQAGNLGGGGFMLVRMADGRAVAIDYRESAPSAATRTMYLDPAGKVIPGASTVGARAVGVPGTVAGLALAQSKYGKLKWRDVVEPARKLAAEGFTLSSDLAGRLRASKHLGQFSASRRIFQRGGKFYAAGDRFRQPELAATLDRLERLGPKEFYEGETARQIVATMKSERGLITLEDLKRYRPALREPLRGTYRGYRIITMPPPSSGGIALLEMLNMLERHDLPSMPFNSAATDHLLIETMRLAFADRSEFAGDTDFVKVPVAGLISKSYAAERDRHIDLKHATPSAEAKHGDPFRGEKPETTHYSIVDAEGNAVSNTYTLNGIFGSGVTVDKAGFLLNNEMDDFTAEPGTPNQFGLIQGEQNSIAPRKRPLSSMTPTILLKGDKLFLVVGSPGGPTIINTVLQVVVNVVDYRMNVRQAVEAPRLHHQWQPDQISYEPLGLSEDTRAALLKLGHHFAPTARYIGDAQAVMIDPQTGDRLGASDPRGATGRAIGY